MYYLRRLQPSLSRAQWMVVAALMLSAVMLFSGGCSSGDGASAAGPPDPKATYRASHPTPTPIPVANACPSKGAVCTQATQIATLLAEGSYEPIAAQATGIDRACTEPIPMVLEPRCPDGATGAPVTGATLVVAAKPVQFLSAEDFQAQLMAALGDDARRWHVAAVGCPGRTPSPDCSEAFTVVLSRGEASQVIALTYTAARDKTRGLIGASLLLPDAPALAGGEMEMIYLDRDAAFTGSYWFMPWEPRATP